MANPAGEAESDALRLDFDRRLMLQFRGSVVTSEAGLLAYRELDQALGFSTRPTWRPSRSRTSSPQRSFIQSPTQPARLHGRDLGRAPQWRTDPRSAFLRIQVGALAL